MRDRYVTGKDLRFMIENGGKMSDKDIAEAIGCSAGTINYHRKRYGFKSRHYRLTEEQLLFMKEHYRRDIKTKEMAKMFGISVSALYHHAMNHGISNDTERNKY